MSHFEINMFGGISLTYECGASQQRTITESAVNSPKMWSLLAYLALNKDKRVTIDELTDALWESKEITNPLNSIKVLIFKLRKTVEMLGFENPRDFITCKNGVYSFSKNVEITTDVSKFEELCSGLFYHSQNITPSFLSQFKSLYKGDALRTLQSHTWALSYSTYLHSKFVKMASQCLSTLIEEKRYDEAQSFCRYVTEIEPFHEYFHRCVIISLLKTDQVQAALKHYNFVCKSYLEFLGQQPSAVVTDTYSLIKKAMTPRTSDVYQIRKELDEETTEEAFFCNYETFREIYRVAQRTLKRQNAHAACGAIIVTNSISSETQSLLSFELAGLQTFIGKHLRCGDVYTRIDGNLFFILMNGTTDENTDIILHRLVKLYKHTHRNSKLNIDCLSFENDSKKRLSRFCP